MEELKQTGIRLIEIVAILSIGLVSTVYFLKPIYENVGILFHGNVWVNWFGVSYILFVLYTLIVFLFSSKKLLKNRVTSVFFWLILIGSLFVVFIPFVKGENPF